QKEFYQFFAFFNTISEKASTAGQATPSRCCHYPSQQRELGALKWEIAEKEAATPEKQLAALQRWENTRAAAPSGAPQAFSPDQFSLTVWVAAVGEKRSRHLKRGSHVQFSLIDRAPDDSIRIQTRERFAQGSWYHFAIVYDGSREASGVK